MGAYLPRDWPAEVHPPGTEDFERSAKNWLLDVVPPEYLRHEVLRRHPAALVSMARYHADASVRGAREGYRTARSELGVHVPPHAVDDVLDAYRVEGFKLAATARGVELIQQAILGASFPPRL